MIKYHQHSILKKVIIINYLLIINYIIHFQIFHHKYFLIQQSIIIGLIQKIHQLILRLFLLNINHIHNQN